MLKCTNIKVNNILNESDLCFLNDLKGKRLDRIYVDYEFSSFERKTANLNRVTYILFDFGNNDFFRVENEVVDEEQDRDEYSRFRLSMIDKSILNSKHKIYKMIDNELKFQYYEDYRWQIFDVHNSIEKISVYRDNAVWNYNGRNWNITTDVAVLFSGSNFKFLCVLEDSIGAIMSVRFNFDEDVNSLINQYWCKNKWGMKCEDVEFLDRRIIVV